MPFVPPPDRPLPDRPAAAGPVATGADGAVLGRIADPGVTLAVWRRPRPPALAWLDGLDWAGIDDLDLVAPLAGLDAAVADGLDAAGYPAAAAGSLADEVAALARRAAAILDAAAVRVRLEVIEGDACRRFHADRVAARLLATLVGPATQWIEAAAPDRVHQLGRGDVALFEGTLRAPAPAVLHRSPPISGTGNVRLLLAVDPGPGPGSGQAPAGAAADAPA